MGWYPKKGTLLPGSDADIVLFDPRPEWTLSADALHMAVDFSPYEGWKVTGRFVCTLSRGEIIMENGEVSDREGRGRFLGRSKK
jgi:dihydropyrimidinase